jgi:tRNA1(Val) A37 N6-methylase TrmN6
LPPVRKGIVRAARRPPGWIAPGPRPAAPPDLLPRAGEDLCYLTGDWRIFQRLDGHRWSVDDLVTAWVAAGAAASPARILDLGCGIGSVLLMVAWRHPAASCLGIEAQDVSVELARRSIVWNGARAEVRHGDLRDPRSLPEGAAFELVTGTPPYFVAGEGTRSPGAQRDACRFEQRGGVEDYCAAAARALAPGGAFVMCAGGGEDERARRGAAAAGFAIRACLDVIPREGKPVLFRVYTLEREASAEEHATLTVRDAHGAWTSTFRAVRRDMGMP